MNKNYVKKLWKLIDDTDKTKILEKLNIIEEMPSQMVLTAVLKSEKSEMDFLDAVKEYFLGTNIDLDTLEDTDDRDTILGLIANYILENDDEKINYYFSELTTNNDKQNEEYISQDDNSKTESSCGNSTELLYLGHIEISKTFYNFVPEFYYNVDGSVTPIDENERREKFPELGKINLEYKQRSKSYDFLINDLYLNDDIRYGISNNSLYIMKIDSSYIIENENSNYQRKINLQDLIDKGVDLSEIIQPIENLGFYKIVTPKVEELNAESFSSNIFVNEYSYNADSKVLLRYADKLYGPYLLKIRNIDKEKYINPNAVANNYIVKAFDFSDAIKLRFSREENGNDRFYTDVANIKEISKNGVSEDKMPDTILLKKFKDDRNLKSLMDNPDEFIRQCETAAFLKDIPERIYHSRIERINRLFSDTVSFDNEQRMIVREMLSTLKDEELNVILGSRIKDTDTYKALQDDMKTALEEKDEEILNLNATISEKEKELQEAKENNESNIEQDSSSMNEELIKENEELRRENEEYKEKEELNKSIDQLRGYKDYLSDENQKLEKEKTKLENKKEEARKSVEGAIEEAAKNSGEIAFDPYISNIMLKAAADWQKEEEIEKYNKAKEKFKEKILNEEPLSSSELVDKLVERIQKYRNYSKNDIINLMICISQNFLTVFSGEPGTGKTSICNIIAHCLGLDNLGSATNDISINRYVPVSVERGWSSKRDLIGYYNPLTKQYDSSNSNIYNALRILDSEGKESAYPYIVLLDEANLSPMEYYWADFMRATDRENQDIYINIGLEKDIYIPQTLRFLATINNDQTTEQLSPRLLDRTWIIKLPTNVAFKEYDDSKETEKTIVSWKTLQDTFNPSRKHKKENNGNTEGKSAFGLKNDLDNIFKMFEKANLSVSPRIKNSINNYIYVAKDLMENEVGSASSEEKALDYAVVQKLLPKIDGYWKNYEKLFKDLSAIAIERHLERTLAELDVMERFQERNMGYCKYLV